MSRLSDSVQARLVQPWQQRYFSMTRYGEKLKSFHNRFPNRRCFLIGNGPSLSPEDLETLALHKEICFGFNRIYHIFNQTSWRPDFYICQDEKMLSGCVDAVCALDLPVKFIPIQMKWYHGIHIPDAIYFNILQQNVDDPHNFRFSENPAQCLYNSSTVLYTAAQLAAYMGFSQIYLLGVDHHFRVSQNSQGKIIVDDQAKDYFSELYNIDRGKLFIPNPEKSTLTYAAMKSHCEKRNIQIHNATRGGKLEVFPRVSFDSLFMR